MKKFFVLLLFLMSCGNENTNNVPPNTDACTVTKLGSIATITCPNGTTSTVSDGSQGSAGASIGLVTSIATVAQCANGGTDLKFFEDLNNNGTLDANENVTSVVTVCNGAVGANGSTVSVTQASASQCSNGGLVITNQNGNQSSSNVVCNGATGPQGQTGPAGTSLSSISMVQFCAGYATVYPSVFPEFGMCISGKLYAVYWDVTNAWLAEVVPGNYLSTSTSAPCNFSVLPNCVVQQ